MPNKYPTQHFELSRYQWAEKVLCQRLEELPDRVLYDIGAGDERMKKLSEVGYSWYGYDLAPQGDAVRWDLNEQCPRDVPKADAAIMLDVLEHCDNPGLALINVNCAINPGALLILTVPNPKWSRSRVNFFRTGMLECFSESDLTLNHHVFTPWPHVVWDLLDKADFDVIEYVTLDNRTRPFSRPVSMSYPIRVGAALLSFAIELHDPSSCGMSYGLVARKRGK